MNYQEEAAKIWDIERLFTDLEKIKETQMERAKFLSEAEKLYLCCLLLNYDYKKIIENYKVKVATARTETNKMAKYIKILWKQERPQEPEIENVSQIYGFMRELGYRKIQNDNPNTVPPTINVASCWIWLGAVYSTSPNPLVGSPLVDLGINTPVTISPKRVPAVDQVVTVIENVHMREDRPQASSNYELFPKIKAGPSFLSRGTILVILEVDNYLVLTTETRRTDKTNDVPLVRVWARVAEYNP